MASDCGSAEARIKSVYDLATSLVKVDPNISAQKYYRSGVEMIRMATIYQNERSLEKAYILYVKYLQIFLEKIHKHPQYDEVSAKDKALNQATIRKILPLVEQMKKDLLEEYKNELALRAAERERQNAAEAANIKEKKQEPGPSDVIAHSALTIPRKQGLRNIVIPTRIAREFLVLASSNTANNRETCGILTGKLEKDQLLVTHLLIPKQSGSSDSCATHNEEEIFDYQDLHGLITLGWIHTHPTQTAFLSSVDLHTHCSYQLMMAEAIAIVCAPKYDETGYFMLTPEHGLNLVAHCRATGFHPHPNEKSLYTHAQHCNLDANASLKIVDLRNK